jgi:nitroreductase
MDALEALTTRRSSPRLSAPAPTHKQIDIIVQAALRAADHALLHPSRFLLLQDQALTRLGELFLDAEIADGVELTPAQREKILNKPLRAPTIIVAIAALQEHPKVPTIEQEYSSAAAVQCMSLAAYAQGLGSMWRTGSKAYHEVVRSGLGVQLNEKIIGFLYLGTPCGPLKGLVEHDINDYLRPWEFD